MVDIPCCYHCRRPCAASQPDQSLLLLSQVVWFANAVVYYGLVLLVTTVSPQWRFADTTCRRLKPASAPWLTRRHPHGRLPDHRGILVDRSHVLACVQLHTGGGGKSPCLPDGTPNLTPSDFNAIFITSIAGASAHDLMRLGTERCKDCSLAFLFVMFDATTAVVAAAECQKVRLAALTIANVVTSPALNRGAGLGCGGVGSGAAGPQDAHRRRPRAQRRRHPSAPGESRLCVLQTAMCLA